MTISVDSKLGEIFDDPRFVKIFDQQIPGLSSHPMLSIAKGLQIKYLLKQPQAKGLGFTKENVGAILDACNKLGDPSK
jgi:hypothetical protein